jgi:hypothetical protein
MKNLAAVFRRPALPASPRGSARVPIEPLWFEWITLFGLLAFGTWLLGVRGVWGLLLGTDPTGLTLVIIIIFVGATLWCGRRTLELQQQRRLLDTALAVGAPLRAPQASWAGEYWRALAADGRDIDAPLDILLESTHGPHSTAWWVNGIQLKLGLLGKVIGFSVLAIHIGQMQNFDPAQSQDLLKSLTTGLGIALLTTMVGLVGNVLLGLQLTRLDRFADALVTDCQRAGVTLARTTT